MTEVKEGKEKIKEDNFSKVTAGLILILLGVLFLLATLDYLSWGDWWAYFLIGLGAIFIFEVVVRAATPRLGRRFTGKLIAGIVLIIIGAAHIFGWVTWWPLILIAVGLGLIISYFYGVRS